ncbi:MAG TPA: cohesin domain-containing protein, partial [Candidatus Eisenbacteria bacterium]
GDVTAGFIPQAIAVAPGDTFTVDVAVMQAGAPFNAFDASVRFDPSMVSFVPTSPVADQRGSLMTQACANTFHRFDVAPDSLKITLSLLCSNTFVTGPGTIYRVRFLAGNTPGTTTISLGRFTEFYNAGIFVRPLVTQELPVEIRVASGVDPESGTGGALEFSPPAPNPLEGRGPVWLGFSLPDPDDVSFELLDVQGRRVAGRDAQPYGGGRHQVSWSPPPLAGGSYFVRLITRSHGSVVRRWTVVR